MPINWGIEADHKLLLKVLETHPGLTIDLVKVAESWPDEADTNEPTPRAIGDRLKKVTKEAGFKTPIKLSGSTVKLTPSTRVKIEFDDASMPSTQTPLVKNPNFIRSSFSTPYRKPGAKSRTVKSKSTRKRKYDDFTDEDEAMSSAAESESDVDAIPVSEEAPSTRSSKRRRTSNPKYNTQDVHASTDEEEECQASDESDGGYDPVLEHEQEKARQEKRGRARKSGRRCGEDEEKA